MFDLFSSSSAFFLLTMAIMWLEVRSLNQTIKDNRNELETKLEQCRREMQDELKKLKRDIQWTHHS